MKDRKKHKVCGALSGIPKCCIDFWVNEWSAWSENQRTKHHIGIPDSVFYVPCPKCIERKEYVNIRSIQDCEVVIPIKCPRRKSCVLWQRV